MPRLARIVVEGYPHHITQRGNNRETVFFDDNDRNKYLELLCKYSKECSCSIHSYCLMSNHSHLLVIPSEKENLSNMMQKLSLRYTQLFNERYKRTGRLWECRFHSCLVDKDSYLWAVCRYIEINPVRAKIVSSAEAYPWSSVRCNILGEKNDLIEKGWLTEKERIEYQDFLLHSQDSTEKEIRKSTYSGKPLGRKPFLDRISKVLNIDLSEKKAGRPKENRK